MIDNNILNNLLNESNDTNYIKNLYNVYLITEKVDNEEDLKKLEDEIYTVDGKVFNDQERLAFELKRIIRKNSANEDLKSKEIINKKIQNIMELMDEVFDKNIDKNYILYDIKEKYDNIIKETIFSIKRKICILDAELNIPINFLFAAHESFTSIYKKYSKSFK